MAIREGTQVTAQFGRYLAFSFFVATLVISSIFFYLPPNLFERFDGAQAKHYLAAVSILQTWILILLAWWVLYLPAPARWYLACCRMFSAVFLASALSLATNFIPEKTKLVLGSNIDVNLKFDSSPVEVFLIAIASAIFLDRFSRRYVIYRRQEP
jgi:hypothetical protein